MSSSHSVGIDHVSLSQTLTVEIPPRPALLLALQREMERKSFNTVKVAQLVSRDAVMAGALLEAANSAFFNLPRRVKTVDEVISLLGLDQFNAVMSAAIVRKALGVGGMMMARFWDVSEKRAMGMSFLARQTGAVAPDLAHSFGLFCDIGIPLMKVTFPAYLETLAIANRTGGTGFLEVEQTRHGIDHAAVGASLAEKWTVAPEVAQAIRLHHVTDMLYDERIDTVVRAMVALNFVAERAIEEFRGKSQSHEWAEGGAVASEALGVSQEDAEGLCRLLKERF
ncbi:MAG: HDOD domain-containing protein [Burkholderiaceae bacterium]